MSQGYPKLFCARCRKTKPHDPAGEGVLLCRVCRAPRRRPRLVVPDTKILPPTKEK